MKHCLALSLSLLKNFAEAAPSADEIASLPGWNGKLPSRMWSGFLDSTSPSTPNLKQHSNYWFSESQGNPSKDPVVLWQNGGPGAASYFGFFVELGPFQLSDESLRTADYNRTGVPSLFYNEYTWSKLANLLIVNSPPPVGFSYCDPAGPAGNGTSCGTWNDTRVADTNLAMLKSFFKEFPEFSNNDFFITGESYAGVYVPMLAREILQDPDNTIKLKGFAVGDACVGTDVLCGNNNQGPWFDIMFFYGHGQVSEELYESIRSTCTDQELKYGNLSPQCAALVSHMNTQLGGVYPYNLYDECWGENDLLRGPHGQLLPLARPFGVSSSSSEGNTAFSKASLALGKSTPGYPCGGNDAMNIWVNNTSVRKALHVPLNDYFFSGDNGVGFNYILTEKNLMPFYQDIILNKKLRVLVYNGDTDPGINSFVAQNWTRALGFAETEEWRPWTLDGKETMGGYVTRYQNNFDFLTIRGSGHMVPEFKPAAALELISKFLNNEEYLQYTAPP